MCMWHVKCEMVGQRGEGMLGFSLFEKKWFYILSDGCPGIVCDFCGLTTHKSKNCANNPNSRAYQSQALKAVRTHYQQQRTQTSPPPSPRPTAPAPHPLPTQAPGPIRTGRDGHGRQEPYFTGKGQGKGQARKGGKGNGKENGKGGLY